MQPNDQPLLVASTDQLGQAPERGGCSVEAVLAAFEAGRMEERERWEAPTLVLWPLVCRLTNDLVFTADKAGEVQAAIQALQRLLRA